MGKVNFNYKLQKIVVGMAILLLFGAQICQRFDGQQDTLFILKKVHPDASSFESSEGKYPAFRVFDRNKELSGYGVLTKASGYGGPITVLTGINVEGHVVKVEVIENTETPLYLQRVIDEGFLKIFKGKSVTDSLRLGQDLDAISGATVSSEGITSAVRRGVNQIGVQELGAPEKEKERIEFGIEEVLLLMIFAITSFSVWRKSTRIRPVVLLFSVVFLGFWLNSPVNLGNIASLVSGNAPSFMERPFWWLLIVGTIGLIMVFGKNFYCSWLCPFGAVQVGINKALGLVSFKIPRKFLVHANTIRLMLAWVALMIAFLFANPSIASYEPFSAFFKGQANTAQWAIMGLVLFMSITTNRLWCRFFCPTGAVLDLVASAKRKLKKWVRSKKKQESIMEEGVGSIKRKPPHASQMKQEKNQLFYLILIVFIGLILSSLFINTGIL